MFVAFSNKEYLADFFADFQQEGGSATCFEPPRHSKGILKLGYQIPLLKCCKQPKESLLGFPSFKKDTNLIL